MLPLCASCDADTQGHPHLRRAMEPLIRRGQQQFHEALQLASNLSAEDADKLWTANARNRGVTSFEDLVTKKEALSATAVLEARP